MKKMFFIFPLLSFLKGSSQDSLNEYLLYSKLRFDYDTTHFMRIEKKKQGYLFVFPADTVYMYKIDSAGLRSDTIPLISQSIYGPYKFRKKGNRILFRDASRSKKYNDLYELSNREFSAPDLFSTATDSYNIRATLLNPDTLLIVGNKKFFCFKYLQIVRYAGITYRTIYIDKKTFLPIRIDYYDDKALKYLNEEVFLLIDK